MKGIKLDKIDKSLSVFLKVAAVIGVLWGGYTFVSEIWLKKSSAHDVAFSGCFANYPEGCIDCDFDYEHPIFVDLQVQGGEVGGVLDASYNIKKKQDEENIVSTVYGIIFSSLTIEGKRSGGTASLSIVDWKDGRKILVGQAKIQKQDHVFYWKLIKGDPNLPKETKLYNMQGLKSCSADSVL